MLLLVAQLMEGREHMVRVIFLPALVLTVRKADSGLYRDPQVRNEIEVLKKISQGHPNVRRSVQML